MKEELSSNLKDISNYWINEMAGAPDLIQLPTDSVRIKNQSFQNGSIHFLIDSALMEKLSFYQPNEPQSLVQILLTSFCILLHRYSTQEDFAVCFRRIPGKEVINHKSSYLQSVWPIRLLFTDEITFDELLELVETKVRNANKYSSLTNKELILAATGKESDSPLVLSNVLFEVQSVVENSEEMKLSDSGFDLALSVKVLQDSIACTLVYNQLLYREISIERLKGHFITLVNAVLEDSSTPVLELPLLTKNETHQILNVWNETVVEYPKEKCIHQLFEEQVLMTPNEVAIEYEGLQLTYAELNTKANQLAHSLVKRGAAEDFIVALFVERGFEMILGLLAISKSGATYLPLDPIYPKARLYLILDDAKPIIFLTQKSLIDSIPDTPATKFFLEDYEAYRNESSENLSFGNPEKPAYILYTSGSTGKPKGVPITQKAVVNLVNSMRKLLEFTSRDILLAVTTISFDIAELEMYMPLFSGAKLVIATQETATDMEMLAEKIEDCGATVFQATPVTFKMLMISSWRGKKDLKLIIGGEALAKELVRQLLPISKAIFNSYGPTETAIYSVVRNLTTEDAVGEGYVPIGRPLDNTTLYVLNKKLVPVPIGIPGELYIGGDGLSPGYLNLPAMTDERFVTNPFGKQPGEKMYKTGDLVQYFEDGNLVFLNRVDSQVKIRGFRIELGEIESSIAQYPGIKDNVVIVREDTPGLKKLVGYLILNESHQINLAELRHFLETKLPEYMVPASFMVMEQFPFTLNGKVDRKALPEPKETISQLAEEHIAPITETQKMLAEIWQEIFKIENVGITENFFEMGGNSLIANMLITRINKKTTFRLSLRTLFEKQTIDRIAYEIDNPKEILHETTLKPTIHHLPTESRQFPLSSGQRRLWFVENFEPGNRAYNMPFEYRIKGELDVNLFNKSLDVLIKRHESLRTVIVTVDGNPLQHILVPYKMKIPVEDLELSNEEKRIKVTEQFSKENDMHIFNLEKGPLFICKLLRFNAKNWLFLFNMHHSITDGWSVKIFLEELGLIYTSLQNQTEVNLPMLPITYADYSIWQNDWLKSADYLKDLDFWKKELKGAPHVLLLPMDFHRPKKQMFIGEEVQFSVDLALTEQLQSFSQHNQVSLFVTLLSIFNTLISRYTSQEEFLIGIPISGRLYEEQELLFGLLTNNFLLRVTLKDDMTFPELLEQCKKKFYLSYEHQKMPIDKLIEELKVTRTANISSLFQVMFNFLNMFDEEISLGKAQMELVDRRRHIAQFDLSLHIYETKKSLNCVLEYNSNLFSRGRMERMAGHFTELVKSLMTNPEQKIRKIPLLTEPEKRVILGDWNQTLVEFPDEKCIFQLFEEQVIRTPEKISIWDDHRKLTFQALNEKANKLARHLHHSGAVEGSLVAICIERSVDLLVALLAIQKAGCTYIPLDPIYPKDRLALILEDGQPVVLLTERKLLENLPETPAKNVFIEETAAYDNESGSNTEYKVTPETVAYLIYTSGSTGKPKGVQIQHRSLVNFIASMAKQPGIIPEDILLAVTTISFDIAGLEMYLPAITGASIFVATQETSMNPDLLIEKIKTSKATILQATPVTFRMLNSAEWGGSKRLKILCGGEAMPKELAYDLVRKCKELWNMYGPTETTVWSTVEKVSVDENDKTGYINLGKPIDNTFIYVLNTEFQPVPIGYPGELFIGGDGLAKGYFNLPEMTRDRFLPDPFSGRAGDRMYRTGDLVQQTEEGKLEFLNRVDSQVKIRGFRIELGEIESALTQFPTIGDNVVIVREDTPGDKKLVAYIIKKENQETDLPELRKYLRTKIPDYMVPSAFVFIDQFPLTPNGKIDRKVLPSPQDSAQPEEKEYVAPITDTEIKLAAIWCEILKAKRVGVDENFFEIGGHSMIAVTLMVKIEKEMGVRLPLAILFDHSTVRDMALVLDKKTEPINWGSLVPIRAKGLDGVDEPLNTIEEIAEYYNSEILKVDNSGSCALAGFSVGGQLAYEMAKQLGMKGKKVSFLGVFDTVSENASDLHIPLFKRYYLRADRFLHQVCWITTTFLKKPANKRMVFVKQKWRSMKQKFNKDDHKIKHEGASLGKQNELPEYVHKVHKANYAALKKIHNNTLFGQVVPFQGDEPNILYKRSC